MSLPVENKAVSYGGLLHRWLAVPRRMARRKGFGIHSPFAFDFVRRVIAQPCAYYDYERIGQLALSSGLAEGHLRLLFRLGLFFRPRHIVVAGSVTDAEVSALAFGCPMAYVCHDTSVGGADSLWIVCRDAGSAVERMVDAVRSGAHVVILDARAGDGRLDALWSGTDHGMLFCGRRAAVYAGMKHLPHQCFDIWF